MTRDTKLYFEDIFKVIEEVEEFMGNLSFDDFFRHTKVIRAVMTCKQVLQSILIKSFSPLK
jgi:uncharacterized protein with HEPN domain